MQLLTKINLDDSYREERHRWPGRHDAEAAPASQNDDDRHDPDADSSLRQGLTHTLRVAHRRITARAIKEFHAAKFPLSTGRRLADDG